MNEKKLSKVLRDAANDNKLKAGFKEVLQYIKGTKLLVVSKSLPEDSEEKLRKIAEDAKVAIIKYPGNSVSLGRLCSLSYGASVVSLKSITDEEINEIIS
jgi:large subunit ribosomal protein L30e